MIFTLEDVSYFTPYLPALGCNNLDFPWISLGFYRCFRPKFLADFGGWGPQELQKSQDDLLEMRDALVLKLDFEAAVMG